MSIICHPRERCNKWRECDRCARIRQAKIADVAENRLARNHFLTYIVLTTDEPITLASDKDKLIRSISRLSSGGIWTVEAGEQFRGLHINLLVATEKPLNTARVRKLWKNLGTVHLEPVYGWREYWNKVEKKLPNNGHHTGTSPIFTNQLKQLYERNADEFRGLNKALNTANESVRSVAAYMSKKEGQPTKAEFSGRIFGKFGSARGQLKELLISENMQEKSPQIAALALTHYMAEEGVIKDKPIQPEEVKTALKTLINSPEANEYAHTPNEGVKHFSCIPDTIISKPDESLERQTAQEYALYSGKKNGKNPKPEPPKPKPKPEPSLRNLAPEERYKHYPKGKLRALVMAGVIDEKYLTEQL